MTHPHISIIAEAGVNHNGSLDMALRLVDAAAEAGADIVKFQTFKAANLASASAPKAAYQTRTTDGGESQLDMLRRLELSETAHERLLEHCKQRGIEFLSTPFDMQSLALLVDRFKLRRVKLGSGDLTNALLLLSIARSGAAIVLSTGMASLGEIEEALGVLAFGYAQGNEPPGRAAFQAAYADTRRRAVLTEKVTLLHCTTEYPAPLEDVNLAAMDTLRQAFGLPVGYSDHTVGFSVSIAAAARGATVIEKHFTLDRTLPGPDHLASLEPAELTQMVAAVREVEKCLGDGIKMPTVSERKNIAIARKSLFAAQDVAQGQPFTEANLTVMRPGDGRSPLDYWSLIGTPARRAYRAGEKIDP